MPLAQEWLNEWYPRNETCLREYEIDSKYGVLSINNYDKKREEITRLDISLQKLTGSLDLTDFKQLKVLDCAANQLTSFLTHNNLASLEEVYCHDNQLTGLNLTGLTNLKKLKCQFNRLTQLDLSGLTSLTELVCNNNELTEIDVSHCSHLTNLYCHDNQLTSLDITHNSQLVRLLCGKNQLTGLDITHNSQLVELLCSYNQLTRLDLSSLEKLERLFCTGNQLTKIILPPNNNKINSLRCEQNPLLNSDFLLTINPQSLIDLQLEDNLEVKLKSYLQPGEKLFGEDFVSYITLLTRWQKIILEQERFLSSSYLKERLPPEIIDKVRSKTRSHSETRSNNQEESSEEKKTKKGWGLFSSLQNIRDNISSIGENINNARQVLVTTWSYVTHPLFELIPFSPVVLLFPYC